MPSTDFSDGLHHENEVFEQLVSLDNKEILELGCGTAAITRLVATNGRDRRITAAEVDEIQHHKNILVDDLANVTFVQCGSEAISSENESYDVVAMFSSLHHVPIELMEGALHEVERVLKPGGVAYIAEPVFAGDFNDLIRSFHDEELVREAAYKAIKKAIANGEFVEIDEVFFNAPLEYASFEEFERNTLNVSHTDHRLSPDLYQSVKENFLQRVQNVGTQFDIPYRVNLLQKLP
ncbi:MAG: class I SAM-dependent methyltransferase [Halioglobus sp.]